MGKKYELVENDKITFDGHVLHRVRALRDFGDVHRGDLGGYIEKEENLDQNGTCWVYDHAKVFEDGRVYVNARIRNTAIVCNCTNVYDDALIFNNAGIYGNGDVHGHAKVCGNTIVTDNAVVSGYAKVSGNAQIHGNASIEGTSTITGSSDVFDDAMIFGNVTMNGNAVACETAKIHGDAVLYKNAFIRSAKDYVVIGPVGPRNEYITFYYNKNKNIMIYSDYVNNKIGKFSKIKKDIREYEMCSKEYIREYRNAIRCARKMLR